MRYPGLRNAQVMGGDGHHPCLRPFAQSILSEAKGLRVTNDESHLRAYVVTPGDVCRVVYIGGSDHATDGGPRRSVGAQALC